MTAVDGPAQKHLPSIWRGAGADFGPLLQDELTDAMGISTGMPTALRQLQQRGPVSFDPQKVSIPDRAQMQRFAEFAPACLHLRLER